MYVGMYVYECRYVSLYRLGRGPGGGLAAESKAYLYVCTYITSYTYIVT